MLASICNSADAWTSDSSPGSRAATCSPTLKPARSWPFRCGRPASRWRQSRRHRGAAAPGT